MTDTEFHASKNNDSDIKSNSSQSSNSSHSRSFSSDNQLLSHKNEQVQPNSHSSHSRSVVSSDDHLLLDKTEQEPQMVNKPATPKSKVSVQIEQPILPRRSERICRAPAKLRDYVTK